MTLFRQANANGIVKKIKENEKINTVDLRQCFFI